MTTLHSIKQELISGSNYIVLKKPEATNIRVLILSENQTTFSIPTNGQELLTICRFFDSVPIQYAVIASIDLTSDEFHDFITDCSLQLPPIQNSDESTTSEEYINSVEEALHKIKLGTIDKIVLAQTTWLEESDLNPLSIFLKLCNTTNSYLYTFRIGSAQWIGASPELFLKSNYSTCETVALAGTRVTSSSEIDWGKKEKEEQSIVGEFLVDEFKKLGFSAISVEPTFTKKIGLIEHICNPVKAHVPLNTDWQQVLQQLHPTPALAGYPKSKAIEQIRSLESFDRSFYGGYLGMMTEHHFEFFVNIRCAQLGCNGAQLFAGAGINKDSIPIKEWEETQNKLSVMKDLFN